MHWFWCDAMVAVRGHGTGQGQDMLYSCVVQLCRKSPCLYNPMSVRPLSASANHWKNVAAAQMVGKEMQRLLLERLHVAFCP
eukprot:scaffold194928_cov14-Tisochrysis_lutea.AAC.1